MPQHQPAVGAAAQYAVPPGYTAHEADPSQRFVRDPRGQFVVNPLYKAEMDRFHPNYGGIAGDLATIVGGAMVPFGAAGRIIGGLVGYGGKALRDVSGKKER